MKIIREKTALILEYYPWRTWGVLMIVTITLIVQIIQNSQVTVLSITGITISCFVFLLISLLLWGQILKSSFYQKNGICEVERCGILGKYKTTFLNNSISALQIKEKSSKKGYLYRIQFYLLDSTIIDLPGYYRNKRAANKDAMIIANFLDLKINYLFKTDSLWR